MLRNASVGWSGHVRAHDDYWQEEWCHILFSDEKKFNLDGPDGNSFYYHDTRKPKLLQNKRHSEGGGTMLWGLIHLTGTVPTLYLYFLVCMQKINIAELG